jgi:acetyltransferase-like isoleucine patch superfamily enzyme
MTLIHPLAYVENAVIGARTRVRQFASVTGGTVLGEDCSVSPFAMLHGPRFGDRCRISGGVMMGPGFLVRNDVFIGPNVTVCNDSWPRVHKDRFDPDAFADHPCVVIEDGASIGANAVILPGVRIGAHAMVVAGAVVAADVKAGHLYGLSGAQGPIGSEDTKVRMRFADRRERLRLEA